MPKLIYQRYATLYNQGDKTASGTSPTSFLLAYPSYIGLFGLLLSMMGVFCFDFVTSGILRSMKKPMIAVAGGLMVVNSYNFMISDYLTVMGSHGAFASILVLGLMLFISSQQSAKRIVDVMIAIIMLLFTMPILIVTAFAIRIKLGSPVFFRQMRPGINGQPFELIKFRTMTDQLDENGNTLSDQERLTGFGKFLRSTSMDELPELFNVLKGEMSLVGPRPLLMEYLPLYNREQQRRHTVKPGITGWAQINGRNAISWEQKFELDLWYVDNQSLWLDLKIMATTLLYALKRSGINQEGHVTSAKFNPHVEEQNDDR